ncbi:MAG TPA: tetratricopeptide repeat protein [Polyangia bacterium]
MIAEGAGRSLGARRALLAGIIALSPAGAATGRASEAGGFWERAVDEVDSQHWDQLAHQADALLAPERGAVPLGVPARSEAGAAIRRQRAAKAEPILRQALDLRPADFRLTLALADVETTLGHGDGAVQTLRHALTLAELPAQQIECWLRLAALYADRGAYAQAVAATDRLLALGPADAVVAANVAELLMAVGRLPEAEDRYREAIRADTDAPDRRLRDHSLALSYYGLGVALDRDGQSGGAREMIGRALALDPGMALLHLGQQPGSDVSFVPAGDVHYYLALGHLVAERTDEAEEAFRAFIAAQPGGRWENPARAHLAALEARRQRRSGRSVYHLAGTATTYASGPIPAPLIDVAWRHRPNLLDECLARLSVPPPHEPLRIALDLELDGRGNLTRATVPRPSNLDPDFVGCVEERVKGGLVVSAPTMPPSARPRPTLARVELLFAD